MPLRHPEAPRPRAVAQSLGTLVAGPARERRAVARDLLFRLQRPLRRQLTVEVDGARLRIPTGDREVSRILFVHRRYDRPLLEAALGVLGGDALRGRGFLDVGAHVGSATTTAALAFGASHGVAIEADPRNFRLLEANLAANGLRPAFEPIAAAASDASGELDLELSSYNWGDSRVRRARHPGAAAARGEDRRRVVRVTGVALDDLARSGRLDPERLGLAWIDVQGHEAAVLRGGRCLAAAGVATVVEVWPYALRYADATGALAAQVAADWAAWVDLGGVLAGSAPVRRPAAELAALVERLGDAGTTDVLLLPRPAVG